MLIPLHNLVNKYNIQFKGVLHVGAHECEELNDYEKHIQRNKILWVEALPDKVELCKQRYPNVLIENAVVSDKIEKVVFNEFAIQFEDNYTYRPQIYTNKENILQILNKTTPKKEWGMVWAK